MSKLFFVPLTVALLTYSAVSAADTECNDSIDNDGNGGVNSHDDPECPDPWVNVKKYVTFVVGLASLIIGVMFITLPSKGNATEWTPYSWPRTEDSRVFTDPGENWGRAICGWAVTPVWNLPKHMILGTNTVTKKRYVPWITNRLMAIPLGVWHISLYVAEFGIATWQMGHEELAPIAPPCLH